MLWHGHIYVDHGSPNGSGHAAPIHCSAEPRAAVQAAEALQGIKSEEYRKDYWYQAWLARCHIMRKRPEAAWQLYVENPDTADSYRLLHIIADECYGMGHFYHSAKAFQVRPARAGLLADTATPPRGSHHSLDSGCLLNESST